MTGSHVITALYSTSESTAEMRALSGGSNASGQELIDDALRK